MSWYDDHINAVADRFAKKCAEAPNKTKFIKRLRQDLPSMGWNEQEIDRIIKRIERKIAKEAEA